MLKRFFIIPPGVLPRSDNTEIKFVKNENGQEPSKEVRERKDVEFEVPWGTIKGIWWGPTEVQPIIAMHGIQDNAESFTKLIPMLPKDQSILCIDFPGHGKSSHYPSGLYSCIFFESTIVLRRLIRQQNWSKVKLMGHSMGAGVSFLYASSFPDDVEFIICLDAVSPNVKGMKTQLVRTGPSIDELIESENLTVYDMPSYGYDELVDVVHKNYRGSLTKESAELLVRRGSRATWTPDKFCFTRDPRLNPSLLLIGMPSMDLVTNFARRIKCAYLNVRALSGGKFGPPENYQIILNEIKKGARIFEYHEVEGTHHVLLNNPERVAPIINEFIMVATTSE